MMEPEEYNEYGEIKPKPIQKEVYERGMTTEQQHRLHETKDLYDGNCYLCRREGQKRFDYYHRFEEDMI